MIPQATDTADGMSLVSLFFSFLLSLTLQSIMTHLELFRRLHPAVISFDIS